MIELKKQKRVTAQVTIESLEDVYNAARGRLFGDEVRRIVIEDALVDPNSTYLSLPRHMIAQLGLHKSGTRHVTSSTGGGEADMYSAVRLTIMDRSCTMDVMEVPDDVPVLIGQIPLEHLDLVIDMREHKLIGNPAHGGEHVYELY